MTTSTYKGLGDSVLNKIDIKSNNGIEVDLIQLHIELNIYESIFSNHITGNVVISDAVGLYDELQISGGETLSVSFYTAGKEDSVFEKEFRVTGISNMTNINDTTVVYTLNFISPEEYDNKISVVSEAYTDTCSEISKKLFAKLNSDKEFDVEDTKYLLDIIFPFMTPIEGIKFLSKRAISSEQNRSGFLFFENKNGYNFKSIQTLYQSPSDQVFFYRPDEAPTIATYFQYEFEDNKGLLEQLHDKSLFCKSKVFDISSRTIIEQDKYYTDVVGDKILGNSALPINYEFPETASVQYSFVTDSNAKSNIDNLKDNKFEFDSILKHAYSNSITIQVAGNSDLTVGYTAQVKVLKSKSDDSIKFSEFSYKNMLISKIKHTLKESRYIQTITLTKDSYDI